MDSEQKLDVETVNYIIKLLERRIDQFNPKSKESIVLYLFKEQLANL